MGGLERKVEERHAVVLRMFNERLSFWEISEARLNALVAVPSGLEERHAETIVSMVDAAIEGAKEWGLTSERYAALQQYLSLVMAPTRQSLKDVLQRMQLGGMRDGVAGREWFVDAMRVFLKFEEGR